MKSSKSIIYKRHQQILEFLKLNKSADVSTLSDMFSVSPLTIRRDLQILEEKGLVERFFGGAKIKDNVYKDIPIPCPDTELEKSKHCISKYAASLVEDGDIIFMNSSSTALLMLEYIKDKHVIVVTNNGNALSVTRDPKVELVLTGGEVYERKNSMVGEYATLLLSKVTATKCFIGVSGISIKSGITTSILQETIVNQSMLKKCMGPKYVLADSSKIGLQHNFVTADLKQISCLITDNNATQKHLDDFKKAGLDVKLVNVDE